MTKYVGKSAPLLLARQLGKNGISDLSAANQMQLIKLVDSVSEDILSPVLSRGRLPLARSELMGVLEVGMSLAGIPTEIDGVKVLPDDLENSVVEHYKSASDLILKQEMSKYGLVSLENVDSTTRIRLIEGFVAAHFGSAGKVLINDKIDEIGVRDILKAPFYNRILLMEYILQDLLLFYVKPVTGMMLRSELISLMDINLELAQGPIPEFEKAAKKVKAEREGQITGNRLLGREFEDLLLFLLKREISQAGYLDVRSMPQDVKNRVLLSLIATLFGGMTSHVFTRIKACPPQILGKFLIQYLRNSLRHIVPYFEANAITERVCDSMGLQP